jgi:hypothetical protein
MLLEDLPEKTFHRLLKSVTWAEVEGTFTIKHWLRRFICRIPQPSRWVMSVRRRKLPTNERRIDRLRRSRMTVARLRD